MKKVFLIAFSVLFISLSVLIKFFDGKNILKATAKLVNRISKEYFDPTTQDKEESLSCQWNNPFLEAQLKEKTASADCSLVNCSLFF